MPKFSVIIPIYNVEAYLRQCVDSVLNHEESSDKSKLEDILQNTCAFHPQTCQDHECPGNCSRLKTTKLNSQF